jgi:Tfp pilus assembly protein PilF
VNEHIGNWNDAAVDLIMAMSLSKWSPEGCLKLAHIFEEHNHLEKAQFWITEAIKITPDSSDAYEFRGDILVKQKQFREAVDSYEKATRFVRPTTVLHIKGTTTTRTFDYAARTNKLAILRKKLLSAKTASGQQQNAVSPVAK